MRSGVRVVGAPDVPDEGDQENDAVDVDVDAAEAEVVDGELVEADGAEEQAAGGPGDRRPTGTRSSVRRRVGPAVRRRRAVVALGVVAVLGLAGTIGFGAAWAGQRAQQQGEAEARQTARTFLVALTNFDAKSVDKDFAAITDMATGTFAGQADKFFNSSIRQELETALASSRGQIRSLYVQTYGGSQATVYAVIDQLYVNNKISSPQSDVLRVVVNLAQRPAGWKVSDVTVLTGPSLGSSSDGGASSTGTTTAGSASTSTTAPAG